jgi:hypothetical protein
VKWGSAGQQSAVVQWMWPSEDQGLKKKDRIKNFIFFFFPWLALGLW